MLNQKKVKIFLVKFRKSPAKQFLEIAYKKAIKKNKKESTSSLVVSLTCSPKK